MGCPPEETTPVTLQDQLAVPKILEAGGEKIRHCGKKHTRLRERAAHRGPDSLALPGQPQGSRSQVDIQSPRAMAFQKETVVLGSGYEQEETEWDLNPGPGAPPALDSEGLSH